MTFRPLSEAFIRRNWYRRRHIMFMFMEHLERKLLDIAPEDLKPKLWKRYVDDILEVVKKGSVKKLTEFLNELDDSNNISK